MFNISITRTIKFEKIKINENYIKYYTITDDTIQKIISNYCTEHDIKLKRIVIQDLKCKVKIIGTKDDVYNLFLYLLANYHDALKNFSY